MDAKYKTKKGVKIQKNKKERNREMITDNSTE